MPRTSTTDTAVPRSRWRRTALTVLLAGALTTGTAGIAGIAAAQQVPGPQRSSVATAAVTRTLSLATSRPTVRAFGGSILSGTLASGSTRVGGAVVELWVRQIGSPAAQHLANTRTNALGHFTFAVTTRSVMIYQARSAGARNAEVRQEVVLGFDAIGMRGCDPGYSGYRSVEAAGRTDPRLVGVVAFLQSGYPTESGIHWTTQTSTKVAADGTFRKTVANNLEDPYWRWALGGGYVIPASGYSPAYDGDPHGTTGCRQLPRVG